VREISLYLEERAARRDEGKRGPPGRQGQRGARGERGLPGARGPAGKPAREPNPTIRSWQVDAVRYRASPLMSNGTVGAMFELRPFFEMFLTEMDLPGMIDTAVVRAMRSQQPWNMA